jgi:hypothetical protein
VCKNISKKNFNIQTLIIPLFLLLITAIIIALTINIYADLDQENNLKATHIIYADEKL